MNRIPRQLGTLALAAGISAGCYTSNGDDRGARATEDAASSVANPAIDDAADSASSRGDSGAFVAPSCRIGGAGRTDCGASGESCCTSLAVPGGTFYRTYASSDGGSTAEADPTSVSSFRLDKYAVTVGRFRQFVKAWNGGAGYTPPAGSGKHSHLNRASGLVDGDADGGIASETGWVASDDARVAPTDANLACAPKLATWTSSPVTNENLPINCVTWWESYAFCIWDGGFLPSESEREYAAAGGNEQRQYPWGWTDPGTANDYAIYDCHYPSGSGSCAMGAAPVGTATLGVGRWGHLDLAGNLNEWNVDWFGDYAGSCADCARLSSGSYRVIRGGYFDSSPSYMLASSRSDDPPADRSACIGFRCARTP